MAFDDGVAHRLREVFDGREDIAEKRMFGGIAFMHRGNMCCGVIGDVLMARVGLDAYQTALASPYTREMDFTGRPLRGMVYVDPPGFAEDHELLEWVARCEVFTRSLPGK